MGGALKAQAGRMAQRLRQTTSAFCDCRSGATSMMMAVAFPGLVAAAGIATDFAVLNLKQAALQAAADSAAIAGAKELAVAGVKNGNIEEAAKQFAYTAVENQEKGFIVDAKVVDNNKAVAVQLTENWTPFFAHFLNAGVTPIVVKAKAELAGETNVCVLALDPSAGKTIHMDNSARLRANGCGVYSNSKSTEGIRLDASSTMTASLICSAGGVQHKGGAVQPSVTEDCAQVTDPLASRPAPSTGSCIQNQLVLTSGTHVLTPGNYCKGLEISGTADVTFASGTYVISNGRFRIEEDAKARGTNVGFYLTGNQTRLDFTGNSTISFSGAKEGDMSGLLFFEDRGSAKNRVHRINSAHAEELTGTIYLSRGSLRIDPNAAVAAQSDYTAIIVQRLQLAEGPELVLNSDYSSSNVPVPEGLRAAAGVVLAE